MGILSDVRIGTFVNVVLSAVELLLLKMLQKFDQQGSIDKLNFRA